MSQRNAFNLFFNRAKLSHFFNAPLLPPVLYFFHHCKYIIRFHAFRGRSLIASIPLLLSSQTNKSPLPAHLFFTLSPFCSSISHFIILCTRTHKLFCTWVDGGRSRTLLFKKRSLNSERRKQICAKNLLCCIILSNTEGYLINWRYPSTSYLGLPQSVDIPFVS